MSRASSDKRDESRLNANASGAPLPLVERLVMCLSLLNTLDLAFAGQAAQDVRGGPGIYELFQVSPEAPVGLRRYGCGTERLLQLRARHRELDCESPGT